MKKAFSCFLTILILMSLCLNALAGDSLYIANPNPEDRLHLRTEPSKNAKSLGKYYNGAPIECIGAFNHSGWVQVRVGMGGNSLTGYMNKSYLSSKASASAMPQYVAVKPVKAYQQPDLSSKQLTVAGGRLLSLMGFSDGWWHLMAHTGESEGNYTCFVPANCDGMVLLGSDPAVGAYVSNPDPTDRLHLRVSPDQNAKSLGKYYNGAVGNILSFTDDGEWLQVDLYGLKGWMKTDFITIEGKTNNTFYGMPTVRSRSDKNIRFFSVFPSSPSVQHDATLPRGVSMEVLGLMQEGTVLHVEYAGNTGFVYAADTDYVDPK